MSYPRRAAPDPEDTRPALEEIAAIARADEDTPTMTRCPLCVGTGMVTPEIAATLDDVCKRAKEQT